MYLLLLLNKIIKSIDTYFNMQEGKYEIGKSADVIFILTFLDFSTG